jgi:hypothetical protein
MKIVFFYFLKIIFGIIKAKQFKNIKKILIINKKNSKILKTRIQPVVKHIVTESSCSSRQDPPIIQ